MPQTSPILLHQPYSPTPYPEMVEIEGGTFMMGSEEGNTYERPVHEVRIKDFKLGKYPVTNAQFALFLQAYGSDEVKEGEYQGIKICFMKTVWAMQKAGESWVPALGYEHYPVQYVTWYGAVLYCQWLTENTGGRYRLPSEAEWEYAARGGRKSQENFSFAGGHKLKEVAWYNQNSMGITQPVGMKLPNELGLYDLNGNVWEWCADHWHETYAGAPKDRSPWLSGDNSNRRVVRGGSWDLTGFPMSGLGARLGRPRATGTKFLVSVWVFALRGIGKMDK